MFQFSWAIAWETTGKPRGHLLAYVPSAIWSNHPKVPPTVFGGKHQGQLLVATRMAGQQMGRLLYVTDCESRLLILVDTSAEVSIIHVPPSNAERKN